MTFFQKGTIAPLAMLFTILSMLMTVAYLQNTTSISAMERYRYAEAKAIYLAEAGLNEVGVVVLSRLSTKDTLIYPDGHEFGTDEKGNSLGKYKDVHCTSQLQANSTRKEYIATSTGVVEYRSSTGNDIVVERTVQTTMVPNGFEEFMYFTDKEEPFGPPNTGNAYVNFGNSDHLQGWVHTNGEFALSDYLTDCDALFTDSGKVTWTYEDDSGINYGSSGCNESMFEYVDSEGESYSIQDTIPNINFPPSNSTALAKANANRVFTADDKLDGTKDTLIMTEIEFASGGYYATQWWYLIPPVGTEVAEYDFYYDSTEDAGLNLVDTSYCHFGNDNIFVPDSGYGDPPANGFLVLSNFDTSGTNVFDVINQVVESGHQLLLQNEDASKVASFRATNVLPLGSSGKFMITIDSDVGIDYVSETNQGFSPGEYVKLIDVSAPTGLDTDVEWNAFHYYHNHYDDGSYCEPQMFQHFDFEYWVWPGMQGMNCDIFTCPDEIYNRDKSPYVHMDRTFFPVSGPHVIYVQGGQALVRGVVNGQYTIVTDDFLEYRRHDSPTTIDRVWGNIWIIDDIIYNDSAPNGQVVMPWQGGGTNNVLGLIAGGSVIVANTTRNGAKHSGENCSQNNSCDLIINAAIMAQHGGFIVHYWQNSHNNCYSGVNSAFDCFESDTTDYWQSVGDGRGKHRNPYRSQSQNGIGSGDDTRGTIHLWGSIVQWKRGYLKRNAQGPYMTTSGNIGYYKDYYYDYNLLDKPPPYYPEQESATGEVMLEMASYGEVGKNEDGN